MASNLPSQKPFRHAGGIIRAFEQLGDIPKLPNNPLQRPKSSKRHYSLVTSLSKVQLLSAQFLFAFAPVNAMPVPAPKPQAAQTITLEGKVVAYTIYDPTTTINLAGNTFVFQSTLADGNLGNDKEGEK